MNKDEVILIAETLLEKETITAEEIEGLLKGESKEKKEIEKKPAAKKPAAPKAPKVSNEKPAAKKTAAKKAE